MGFGEGGGGGVWSVVSHYGVSARWVQLHFDYDEWVRWRAGKAGSLVR